MFGSSAARPPQDSHVLRKKLAQPDVRHVLLLMFLAAVVLCGQIQKGDELVVQLGAVRRHVGLPTSMASSTRWSERN